MNISKSSSLDSFEDLKRAQEILINTHHGSIVVELSAVVWSREDGYKLSLGEKLKSFLYNL